MPWLLLQPELAGPLLVIIGAFVLVGLAQISTSQHGSQQTHSFWWYLAGGQYLHAVSGFAASLTRYIVSRFAGAHLRQLAHWLKALGTIAIGITAAPALFAEAVAKAIEDIYVHGDRLARREIRQVRRLAREAEHVGSRALSMARADLRALHRFEARVGARISHLTHAIDVTIPRELGRIRAGERVIEKDIAGLRGDVRALEDGAISTFKWLAAHRWSAAMGVFAGAVALALTRLGFGFLRCRNWQQLGRRMTCGMGKWLLDALEAIAGFTLGLLAVLKPEVLAQEAVDAVDGIEYVLSKILEN